MSQNFLCRGPYYLLTIEKEGERSVEPKEGARKYPKDWRVALRATPDPAGTWISGLSLTLGATPIVSIIKRR